MIEILLNLTRIIVFLFSHVVRLIAVDKLSVCTGMTHRDPPSLLSSPFPRSSDLSSSSGISLAHVETPKRRPAASSVELSLNTNTEVNKPIKHNINSIPIGTPMYPRHTHSPTHCFTQSSAVAHVSAAFAATHAPLRVVVFHPHDTPLRSMDP